MRSKRRPRRDASSLRIGVQLVDARAFARLASPSPSDKRIQSPLFFPLNASQSGSTLTRSDERYRTALSSRGSLGAYRRGHRALPSVGEEKAGFYERPLEGKAHRAIRLSGTRIMPRQYLAL